MFDKVQLVGQSDANFIQETAQTAVFDPNSVLYRLRAGEDNFSTSTCS